MYSTEWHIENQVVLVIMSGVITGADVLALNQQIADKYLTPAQNKIHLIVDGSGVTKLPNDLMAITKASKPLMSNPNMGSAVYVQFLNSILGFLANVATQLVGLPYKMVNSVEEAEATLREQGAITTTSSPSNV